MRLLCLPPVLAYTRAVAELHGPSDDGGMMRPKRIVSDLRRLGGLVVTAAVFVAVCGCDLTGQYEKKFQQAIEEAKRRSAFDEQLHAVFTEVVDASRQPVGVKLRLPKKFDAESKVMTQNIVPGQAQIPGSAYVLMRELDDDKSQKAPCIVSIVTVPKAEQKSEPLQSMVGKAMAAVSPTAKWEDVQLPTPSGGQVTLKRMRMETSLPVPTEKGSVTLSTRVDMYLIEGGNNTVLITWFTPKPQAQRHALDKAIDASMGTVEVAAPAGDAAAGGASEKATAACF
jgi:hypothetical protein